MITKIKNYPKGLTAFLTAFGSQKRLLTARKVRKIRWDTLKTGLSRRRQGFESPWGRHLRVKGFQRYCWEPFLLCGYNGVLAFFQSNLLWRHFPVPVNSYSKAFSWPPKKCQCLFFAAVWAGSKAHHIGVNSLLGK